MSALAIIGVEAKQKNNKPKYCYSKRLWRHLFDLNKSQAPKYDRAHCKYFLLIYQLFPPLTENRLLSILRQ